MEHIVLTPFLVKAEVLLVLVTVLAASVAWLFWEIFSFVTREKEESNDWWDALKNCNHRRLIIPPECVQEVPEMGTFSRFTTATTNAVKNMTGVVSSHIQRTQNLISGGNKPLSKAAKKASRQDLASMDGGAASGGGGGMSKSKKKGSRLQLAGLEQQNTQSGGGSPTAGVGRGVKPQRQDMAGEELSGGGAVVADAVVTNAAASGGNNRTRRSSRQGLPPLPDKPKGGGGGSQSHAVGVPEAKAVVEVIHPAAVRGGGVLHPAALGEGGGSEVPPVLKAEPLSSPQATTRSGQAPPSSGGGAATAGGGGYIFSPLPEDCTPLLTFVNSRSGVSQGVYLIHQLRRLLNPIQVVDLAQEDPGRALKQFIGLPRLRILVCGGDGTAKWIMNTLEDLEIDCWPPIAILPLGTGNDMARVLGWGGGYNNESIVDFLAQVQRAHVVVVDRWEMKVQATKAHSRSRDITFNNYFGIGVDAQAALKFHHLREQKPHYFFSRMVNKMWYGFLGAQDLFRRTCVNLPERIKIIADGKEIELPPTVQGIMFLNIESYGGGVKLWGNGEDDKEEEHAGGFWGQDHPAFGAASMQDGLLDVVAVNGIVHLGQLQVGLSKAVKICQCREVVVTTTKDLPMQCDGEPWPQPKGTIKVTRKKDPAYMLKRTLDSGGAVATEMSEILDWAFSENIISLLQKKSLLTEFSRRIESKRRVFEQELNNAEGGVLGAKTFEPLARLRLTAESHPTDCVIC